MISKKEQIIIIRVTGKANSDIFAFNYDFGLYRTKGIIDKLELYDELYKINKELNIYLLSFLSKQYMSKDITFDREINLIEYSNKYIPYLDRKGKTTAYFPQNEYKHKNGEIDSSECPVSITINIVNQKSFVFKYFK
ncbi:MAG: hypothetical protein LBD84_06040 [Campylobacteraceae bacterium]|jgi:hypothetical protein|nr:hypothetical protein [Campylobacteraceae bacterium]